jgi:hypothetical protein
MLMFERLSISKDIVRGTNAVCGALQLRILVYVAMGVFSRADTALYVAVSIGGLVGMAAGSLAAVRVRPAAFSRLLMALMVLCCALMFASAAGLGAAAAVAHHSWLAGAYLGVGAGLEVRNCGLITVRCVCSEVKLPLHVCRSAEHALAALSCMIGRAVNALALERGRPGVCLANQVQAVVLQPECRHS